MNPRRWLLLALAAVLALGVLSACDSATDESSGDLSDPGDCTPVDVAVSSEKIDLLTDLARSFNESDASNLDDGCAFVRVQKKASGTATTLLTEDWGDPAVNGPAPAIWSPASSAWMGVLDERRNRLGADDITTSATPFMNTPLVIAMPRVMAEALGWPNTALGFSDIVNLAQDPNGWASHGHPEWGAFKLGKTNPNYSTSALHFTIAQYYAATNKTQGLSLEDLADPTVEQYARNVESTVVHYGDITMTFLNNWFRNDARGTALSYVSAVAVEEKSVIDYNNGNPDGILDPGEKPRKPKQPLVAIYPKEGTLFSDNPLITIDAPWVSDDAKVGAEAFIAYVREPKNQQRVLEFGFRPANPSVAITDPVSRANGVDPDQPQSLLEVPEAAVITGVIDEWAQVRKPARVLLLVDVSGSMGDPASDGSWETKLELAQLAAINSLDQFEDFDEVGLRIFSTDIAGTEPTDYLDVVPVRPMIENREILARRINALIPTQGTPLYTATQSSYEKMVAEYDAVKINAVVLLSDGRNEDPRNSDLQGLLRNLRANNEGSASEPVRIFPIGYGVDANASELRQIAEATNAAYYSASDPQTINEVFAAVVSNF